MPVCMGDCFWVLSLQSFLFPSPAVTHYCWKHSTLLSASVVVWVKLFVVCLDCRFGAITDSLNLHGLDGQEEC